MYMYVYMHMYMYMYMYRCMWLYVYVTVYMCVFFLRTSSIQKGTQYKLTNLASQNHCSEKPNSKTPEDLSNQTCPYTGCSVICVWLRAPLLWGFFLGAYDTIITPKM